jgi:predicted transcriptional regulator YheO
MVFTFIGCICINILLEIANAVVGTLIVFGCIKSASKEGTLKKDKLKILVKEEAKGPTEIENSKQNLSENKENKAKVKRS